MMVPEDYTRMPTEKYERTLEALKNLARATHADYPQYAGHWDDWVLVILARNIECKGGRALEFWQISIGKTEQPDQYQDEESWTVYSPQRDSNIGRIPLSDAVEVVPC